MEQDPSDPTDPYRSVPIRPPIHGKIRPIRAIRRGKIIIFSFSFFLTDRWVRPIFYNGSVSGSDGSVKIGGRGLCHATEIRVRAKVFGEKAV